MPNKEKFPEFDSGENEWTKTIKEQVKELTSLTYKLVFLSKIDEAHGIGLSVVKAIAELHKGNITVTKKDGNVISFCVTL